MSTISSNIAQQMQSLFTRADADGDDALTLAEFKKADGQLGTSKVAGNQNLTTGQRFKKLDADGNGKVTSAELTAGTQLEQQALNALLQMQDIKSGASMLKALSGSGNGQSANDVFSALTGGAGASTTATTDAQTASLMNNLLTQLHNSTDDATTANITNILQQLVGSYTAADATAESTGTTTTQTA